MDDRAISKRLTDMRTVLISEYPFFGRLLLKLRFGLAECGTAFTDMQRIVFDRAFATRLGDDELKFVLLHEVMHCALKHCTRSAGKHHYIYNIACDIVVNSTIMTMLGRSAIIIDGCNVMHITPDGTEGAQHSAEEVYSMLMRTDPEELEKLYGGGNTDDHSVWDELDAQALEETWEQNLKEAVAACGVTSGIPSVLARYLADINRSPRTNWRQVLHDFIQFDKSDYCFSPPDRRYQGDMILPAFCDNVDGSKIEKLWFAVDTSGSVTDEALAVAYNEIQQATYQIDSLSGFISYFDHSVSDPVPFESLEQILEIKPIGGGGTSFAAVFKKLSDFFEQKPNVIVIITDGYDFFPDEEAALGVPVIWLIVDSDVVPPWGAYAHITTTGGE